MGAGIALQSAGADSRIEGRPSQRPLSPICGKAAYYEPYGRAPPISLAGQRRSSAPGAWLMVYSRRQSSPVSRVPRFSFSSGESCPRRGRFPVLYYLWMPRSRLIPCRHSEMIFPSAPPLGRRNFGRVPSRIPQSRGPSAMSRNEIQKAWSWGFLDRFAPATISQPPPARSLSSTNQYAVILIRNIPPRECAQ